MPLTAGLLVIPIEVTKPATPQVTSQYHLPELTPMVEVEDTYAVVFWAAFKLPLVKIAAP